MTGSTREKQLQKLYLERDAKFEEIVSCVTCELYSSGSPLSEADRKHLVEEAEELTDKWAEAKAQKKLPELTSALQVLLSDHQNICERIITLLGKE
jgi:hypothetical protein